MDRTVSAVWSGGPGPKEEEALCLELGDKNGLLISFGNQAVILRDWGRFGEALEFLKKQEALCVELGDKNSLQACYGNQALIQQAREYVEEAMELFCRVETMCLELGNKNDLQRTYGNKAVILRHCGRFEEPWCFSRSRKPCVSKWATGLG